MKKGLRPRSGIPSRASGDSNRRPDEEGIKTACDERGAPCTYSNRRPDEEGIKTAPALSGDPEQPIPTADLMKKGLRRVVCAHPRQQRVIPTADLMKKGLRRRIRALASPSGRFQPQT